MHSFDARIALRSLTAAGVAAFLAACSSGPAVSPTIGSSANAPYVPTGASTQLRAAVLAASGRSIVQSSHGVPGAGTVSPASIPGSHVIYSGNFSANTITIYPIKGTNPAPIGTISTGLSEPERLFVGKNLNLYATNLGTNTVVGYKPGATSPYLTISSGVDGPTGITVGADGTIYCANTTNNTVTEYPRGKTSPKLTVTLSGETPENLAVDGANNLYIQYDGGTLGSGVVKVPHGQTTGTDLSLVIGSAGALSVDSSGNVVILDTASAAIDVFPPGQTTPSKTLSIGGFPFELSMTKSEKQVYVSSIMGSPFVIQVANYPNLTSVKTKISSPVGDWPLAVAPDNAL